METRLKLSRIRVIGGWLVLAALICLVRLFQLQVLQYDHYTALASEEHLRKYQIPASRGEIYILDRDQPVPAALNQMRQVLYADPRFIVDPRTTAQQLSEITGQPAERYEKQFGSDSYYVVLDREVEPDVAARIESLHLGGIGLQDSPKRVYPEGNLAAQVTGFINAEGEGQYGIESQLDSQLRGRPGLFRAKTDTAGIPIATADNIQISPQDGADVVLTIERNVQAKVESVLRAGMEKYTATGASAVVMDARSGRVLAMANYPTFDPNKFERVEDYSVFSNRVVSGLYEPGSVIKGLSMASALDQGVLSPTTTYQDTGSVTVDGWKIENAAGIPVGTYTMHDVIAKSINTGVVFALQQLGGGEINDIAKSRLHRYFTEQFRLGRRTGIDLPAEAAGSINEPSASNVNYANMTFGQGMSATMLQVVSSYAALANGGTLWRPYVVDHIVKPGGEVVVTEPNARVEQVVSSAIIRQLKPMFRAVIEETGDAVITGYALGGKSGTAQIPNPDGGYFENRDIGSFVGIVTLKEPRYVVMVRIDEPQIGTFASAAARPMFGEIAGWLLNYYGIPPTE